MSLISAKASLVALLTNLSFPLPPYPSTQDGQFAVVSDGERKDYLGQTPVAAVMTGAGATELLDMPQTWKGLYALQIMVLVAYSDEYTGEQTRDAIIGAVLHLLQQYRRLNGAADVLEQTPKKFECGYVEIAGTTYLMATIVTHIWDHSSVPALDR